MRIFSAIYEINNGMNGISKSNYSGNDIPWSFSTSKNGSFWHLLVVQVYLISNSHDSPLFKLLYGCYKDSHGSKNISVPSL